MSRSGYSDGVDQWDLIRWRGAVASSIRGQRGQAFLRELVVALDAMPVKRLIARELRQGGEVCTLGAIGATRGVDLEALDPKDYSTLASIFGVASPLIQEIEWKNDDAWCVPETPESRWMRMRKWVADNLKPEGTET
jgi:hypothetical protein